MVSRSVLALALGLLLVVPSPLHHASAAVTSLAPTISSVAGFAQAHWIHGAFKNIDPDYHRASWGIRLRSLITGATWFSPERRVAPLPVVEPHLAVGPAATVTWIGHSTLLVQLDGA